MIAPFKFSTRGDMLTRRSLTHSVSAGAPIKKRSLACEYTHRAGARERKRSAEGVVDAHSGWLLVRAHFQYKKVKRLQVVISLFRTATAVVTMDTRWRGCAGILARQKNTIHS
jgi:hypothetical protein